MHRLNAWRLPAAEINRSILIDRAAQRRYRQRQDARFHRIGVNFVSGRIPGMAGASHSFVPSRAASGWQTAQCRAQAIRRAFGPVRRAQFVQGTNRAIIVTKK
jgi:hypothetical protein